jgi:hypothetical protein
LERLGRGGTSDGKEEHDEQGRRGYKDCGWHCTGGRSSAPAGAVVKTVVEAVQEGSAKLDEAAPALQKSAAAAVSKPIVPTRMRKSARAKAKAPARKPKCKPVAVKKKSAAKKKHS